MKNLGRKNAFLEYFPKSDFCGFTPKLLQYPILERTIEKDVENTTKTKKSKFFEHC